MFILFVCDGAAWTAGAQRGRSIPCIETLLEGVAAPNASIVIMNITGVASVDTLVASMLIQAARAVRLLGARVILTGISAEVARTLVGLGADLGAIETRATLQDGIALALKPQS